MEECIVIELTLNCLELVLLPCSVFTSSPSQNRLTTCLMMRFLNKKPECATTPSEQIEVFPRSSLAGPVSRPLSLQPLPGHGVLRGSSSLCCNNFQDISALLASTINVLEDFIW